MGGEVRGWRDAVRVGSFSGIERGRSWVNDYFGLFAVFRNRTIKFF